jgi:hypothetical protein
MFQILTSGLFLTFTENSFLFCTHIKSSGCVFAVAKRSNLLGKAIHFSWRRILYPLRSLVPSQLSLRALHFPHPHTYFPHTEHLLLHTKTTFPSPILLSGTIPTPFIPLIFLFFPLLKRLYHLKSHPK